MAGRVVPSYKRQEEGEGMERQMDLESKTLSWSPGCCTEE